MSEPPLKQEDADAMNTALSFYSSELTSHAGLAIAFGIAVLTVVQVRLGNPNPSPQALTGLILAMTVAMSGGIYSLLRVPVYAGLADTILHGYLLDFQQYWDDSPQKDRKRLPLARVNEYALHTFNDRHPKLRHFFNFKCPPTWIILPISLGISIELLLLVTS